MPAKLCALVLIVLAVSPFTAPFQTCPFADSTRDDATDSVILVAASTSLSVDDAAGSLVAPLTTYRGRLTLTPVSALAVSKFITSPLVALAASQNASTHCAPLYSTLPSVLRL